MDQYGSTVKQAVARSKALEVRILRTLADLEPYAEDWDDLVFGAGRLPMLSHAWLSAHLEFRQPTDRPWLCLVAVADGRLVGVLPLEERRVTVLGKEVVSLHQPGDGHTRSIDAVFAVGWERRAATAFREALDEAAPGWYGVELLGVEERSRMLGEAESLQGVQTVVNTSGLATVRATQGTWDDFFMKECSGHFRKHFRQYGRKLAKLGTVQSEFYTGAEATPEYLDRFAVLEAAGWKGREGSAIGADPLLREFYRAVCSRLHARRVLEWHFLRVDERYVAGHFAIRSGRTLVLWKIGYDEAYAECSPGFLLIGEMLVKAFADSETDEVNFVTDRTWLSSWRPTKARYYDVWIYPRRVRSVVAGVWPKRARQRLRDVPGLKAGLRAVRALMKK